QVALSGALDSLAVETGVSARNVRWRAWHVPAGRGRFAYAPGPAPLFALDVALDSLRHGRLGFGAAIAHAPGPRDSLTWFARSRARASRSRGCTACCSSIRSASAGP